MRDSRRTMIIHGVRWGFVIKNFAGEYYHEAGENSCWLKSPTKEMRIFDSRKEAKAFVITQLWTPPSEKKIKDPNSLEIVMVEIEEETAFQEVRAEKVNGFIEWVKQRPFSWKEKISLFKTRLWTIWVLFVNYLKGMR